MLGLQAMNRDLGDGCSGDVLSWAAHTELHLQAAIRHLQQELIM